MAEPARIIYWRRELPPLSEEIDGEHVVEATSARVHASWAERDLLWGRCYEDLMIHARDRIAQEVTRLGGSCAHVTDEIVRARTDDGSGDFWLEGTFTYTLYRHPAG